MKIISFVVTRGWNSVVNLDSRHTKIFYRHLNNPPHQGQQKPPGGVTSKGVASKGIPRYIAFITRGGERASNERQSANSTEA